jgi:hypothetical protein
VTAFSYDRSIAPSIWTLLAISVVEMATVHLLISLWLPIVGLALIAASLAGIVWLCLLLRSMTRLPVLVGEGVVIMRIGTLRRIDVPADAIGGLRDAWTARELKARDVAGRSLLAFPNVVLDLARPLQDRRGRPIRAIAHRLDDPVAFSLAVARLRRRDGHG